MVVGISGVEQESVSCYRPSIQIRKLPVAVLPQFRS